VAKCGWFSTSVSPSYISSPSNFTKIESDF
jgi:hypothetical protein